MYPTSSKHIHRVIVYSKQWECRQDINPIVLTVHDIVNFLAQTFHRGVYYDYANTARGALSSLGIVVDGCRAGNHPLVNRVKRGIFILKPSMPKYQDTWDVKPVLTRLQQMEPLQTLSLKDLTVKLVVLMALTQAALASAKEY